MDIVDDRISTCTAPGKKNKNRNDYKNRLKREKKKRLNLEEKERNLMAAEDNRECRRIPDSNSLSSVDGGEYTARISQVLDEIEASHNSWNEKRQLYIRIEVLLTDLKHKDE